MTLEQQVELSKAWKAQDWPLFGTVLPTADVTYEGNLTKDHCITPGCCRSRGVGEVGDRGNSLQEAER